jgi:hypothetical protein
VRGANGSEMSAEVQKIIEAVRTLSPAQLSELRSAPGDAGVPEPVQSRAELARSLMGKYAWVRTSSEEFARSKEDDLDLEEQPRWCQE